jgi:uncharacterized cupredoxin-like copper-binding protein
VPIRAASACAAIALVAALALAACGDSDDSDDSTQSLSFSLGGQGKSAKFTGPEAAEAGEAEISFTNDGAKEADFQLIRVEGDHSPEEVTEGLGSAIAGKPFPEWFFAAGGTPIVKPGDSATVTQVLEPGTYYPFDTEGDGKPDPKTMLAIEVTGEAGDEELEADMTVSAGEYVFTEDGLTAGENEILFENIGVQPHHLLISELKGDATAEEVEAAFKADKGPPPLVEKGTQSTAVIEGGEGQLVTLDLKPGRYAFYCFITDRQGGPPHALKGMVDEFEIE